MDYIDIVIACVTNGIRLWIIWRFMHVFFDVKDGREREELIGYITYYFGIIIIFLVFHYPLFNLIVNWGGLVVIAFLYEGKWKKRILVSTMVYAVNGICDVIAVSLLGNYTWGGESDQVFSIVTVLLVQCCELAGEKIVKNTGKQKIEKQVHILIIIPMISIVMIVLLLAENIHNKFFVVEESVGLIIINTFVWYIYHVIVDTYSKLRKQEWQKQQAELYQNQIDIMTETEQKVRGLRHDMKEHMKELYCLAKEDKADNILEYLKGMYRFMDNPRVFVDSGNKEIDAILNYALTKAEEDLLQIDVNIKIPEGLQLDIFNMNVIIGNLLDNAVTASKTSEKKELKVDINYEKGILYLMIKNTYHGEIKKKGDKFLSNKQEDGHGIGLENVRNMVESMHGTLDIEYTKDEFKVNVMVYQP